MGLTAKRDRQETLHGKLGKRLARVPEVGLTAKRDRQDTLHGELGKRLARVPEVGLRAKRDRQETLHSSFQNNLHQSTGGIRSSDTVSASSREYLYLVYTHSVILVF